MLFRCFRANLETTACGSIRRRSSTQFTVVRLELLEDRFLLTGNSAAGLLAVNGSPGSSSGALIDIASQTLLPVSPPTQQVNVATGTAPINVQSGLVLAGSVQKSPAAASPSQKPTSESNSSASPSPISPVQNAAQPDGDNTSGSGAMEPQVVDCSGDTSSQGGGNATLVQTPANPFSSSTSPAGGGTFSAPPPVSVPLQTPQGGQSLSQPPLMPLSFPTLQGGGSASPSQPPSISVPLPLPTGVPAGGIFRQVAAYSAGANTGVLSLDPVAVDLSLLNAVPSGSPDVTGAIHGGLPTSLMPQSATTTLGFGFLKSPSRPSPDTARRPAPIATAARTARQYAELPDIAAPAPADLPLGPSPEVVRRADPKPAMSAMTETATETQQSVALIVSPALPGAIEAETAEIKDKKQRIPANLAIYSAASLTVAVSAPGLTTAIRRGRDRDKRRSAGARGGRPSASPR